MKIIVIILATLLINACGNTKKLASNVTDGNLVEKRKMMSKKVKTLEYKTVTRGWHKLIRVTEENISYKLNKNEDILLKTKPEDWNELMVLLSEIEITSISSIKAPSKTNQSDRAAQASFSIYLTGNDRVITTPTFDHGNPNRGITKLVEKMITLIPSKK